MASKITSTLVTVSIHALLAECDTSRLLAGSAPRCFNPRTPCGVRRRGSAPAFRERGFQSTHSLRSATGQHPADDGRDDGFNPRTPCGVRPSSKALAWMKKRFQSTHSLRSATGIPILFIWMKTERFQSTHSLRSATLHPAPNRQRRCSFNPRTPCGVRLGRVDLPSVISGFNPRTPCGVRLNPLFPFTFFRHVSIHALLAECDCARPYTLLLNRANHTLRQPP